MSKYWIYRLATYIKLKCYAILLVMYVFFFVLEKRKKRSN